MLDDFFVRALLAGIALAIVAGPVGCFVIWQRLAYCGETIAHSAFLGIALALIFDINFTAGVLIAACGVAWCVYLLDRHRSLPSDTALGLMAHGALATGLVILAFLPDARFDILSQLLGDLLAVSNKDLLTIFFGGLLATGILALIWRRLLLTAMSPELATVEGVSPERCRLLFGILMAVLIAVGIKIVGVLLIIAMLIIPAATAQRFAPSPEWMAVGASMIGVVAIVLGLYSSLNLDSPSGPTIVVMSLLIFGASRLVPRRIHVSSNRMRKFLGLRIN